MSVPLPIPPNDGLHDISPIASSFCVTSKVRAPVLAEAAAASHPAWPAPITMVSYVGIFAAVASRRALGPALYWTRHRQAHGRRIAAPDISGGSGLITAQSIDDFQLPASSVLLACVVVCKCSVLMTRGHLSNDKGKSSTRTALKVDRERLHAPQVRVGGSCRRLSKT